MTKRARHVTTDEIMQNMGFTLPIDTNDIDCSYVAVLWHDMDQRRREQGLTYVAPNGLWMVGGGANRANLTEEDRAKAFLAFFWETDNGHCCVINNVDGFHLGDWFRRKMMQMRILCDKLRGRRNPYI
jgi:hypothetical protein